MYTPKEKGVIIGFIKEIEYMLILRKDVNLANEIYGGILQDNDKVIFEKFKKGVQKRIVFIQELFDVDLNTLDDLEFLKIITSLYNVNVYDNDLLDFVTNKFNKKYVGYEEISTTMVYNEEIGQNNNNFWNPLFQVKYVIAVTDDAKIDSSHVYTPDELRELIASGNAVIVEKINETLDISQGFLRESVEDFPVFNINEELVRALREMISNNIFAYDVDSYYFDLLDEIDDVLAVFRKMHEEDYSYKREKDIKRILVALQ